MPQRVPVEWYLVTQNALVNLWEGFLLLIPKLLGSLIVFVFGWLIAAGAGRLVVEILDRLKFNEIFERGGWGEVFEKAEIKATPAQFVGAVIKWVLVIVFLLAAVEILGFVQFAVFLTRVLAYLPNVIVAVLMLVVAVILADILEKVVVVSVERARVGYSRLAGLLTKWSIFGFAVLAILTQLSIARDLVMTLFTGLVGMLVLSFGLAFGLGGKEVAAEILVNFWKKFRD